MTDLTDLIQKLLGVQCKLYVTRCATWELEELGEGYETVNSSKSFTCVAFSDVAGSNSSVADKQCRIFV